MAEGPSIITPTVPTNREPVKHAVHAETCGCRCEGVGIGTPIVSSCSSTTSPPAPPPASGGEGASTSTTVVGPARSRGVKPSARAPVGACTGASSSQEVCTVTVYGDDPARPPKRIGVPVRRGVIGEPGHSARFDEEEEEDDDEDEDKDADDGAEEEEEEEEAEEVQDEEEEAEVADGGSSRGPEDGGFEVGESSLAGVLGREMEAGGADASRPAGETVSEEDDVVEVAVVDGVSRADDDSGPDSIAPSESARVGNAVTGAATNSEVTDGARDEGDAVEPAVARGASAEAGEEGAGVRRNGLEDDAVTRNGAGELRWLVGVDWRERRSPKNPPTTSVAPAEPKERVLVPKGVEPRLWIAWWCATAAAAAAAAATPATAGDAERDTSPPPVKGE